MKSHISVAQRERAKTRAAGSAQVSTGAGVSQPDDSPQAESSAPPDNDASQQAEIAVLAYRYWQERGCPEGSPEEDWYRAERECSGRGRNTNSAEGGQAETE